MRRWQEKDNPEKDWGEKGPDLLRTKPNARARIKSELEAHSGGWMVRVAIGDNGWEKWTGPHERADILDAFDGWKPPDKSRAQWGRKTDDGKVDAKGSIRARVFDVKSHSGCSDHTDRVIALMETAFPAGAFGGAYVCKQVSGSSTWSQHAYGKAYDHSAYDANDRATDWALRMARENRMRDGEEDIVFPAWQILGSKDGNAGNASNGDGDWIGDFPWERGGVDDSHEWHVHISSGKSKATGTPSCAQKGGLPTPEDDPHDATDGEEE